MADELDEHAVAELFSLGSLHVDCVVGEVGLSDLQTVRRRERLVGRFSVHQAFLDGAWVELVIFAGQKTCCFFDQQADALVEIEFDDGGVHAF